MKLAICTVIAGCFLVSGCDRSETDAEAPIMLDGIARIDGISFFREQQPWQQEEIKPTPELKRAISLAEQHFRSVEPDLIVSGSRIYQDTKRGLVYLTFTHAIPAMNASDPVPPPFVTDFYLVYLYKPAQNRLLAYTKRPGG